MNLRTKKRIVLLALCALACAAIFLVPELFSGGMTEEPYAAFYAQAESGGIESASIEEGRISYSKKNSDGRFYTDNPDSPTLREFLLLHGVQVSSRRGTAEIASLVMDVVFYLFFFGIIVVAFRKFISPNTFRVVRKTGKKFGDVVGLDGLKKDMAQVMEIMRSPAAYAAKGIRMPRGILLEGAPGNGKTLFAKALAGEAKVSFIPAKATDFESMFMAIGPMKVKLLFRKARRNAPCIVFIDEFDGIGTRRNYSGSAIETENTRIVTALLNELDGFEPSDGILVLAATNSVQSLDEALIRPGRFDARVTVPFPDEDARLHLVEMYSRGKQLDASCRAQMLAARWRGFSCAKIESVLNRASLLAAQDGRDTVLLADVQKAEEELSSAR